MSDVKNILEALLFASGKGLSKEELVSFSQSTPQKVGKALSQLQEEYVKRESSLTITHHAGKWKLTVKGKYTPYIEKIVSEVELPGAVLKTLAVIAFKSPVLQSDIIDMRGQGAYDHIKRLAKEKFITKEEHGRSYLLKITDKFYNYFDVQGDQEIREVFDSLRKQQQKITELEIVEMAKQQDQQSQQQLGNLEVVDVAPRRKERSNEEKEQEEEFLDSVDQRLDALTQRVDKQQLSSQDKEIKEDGQQEKKDAPSVSSQEDEDSVSSNQDDLKNNQRAPASKDTSSKDNYLEELDDFAQKQAQKNKEGEQYIPKK